MLRKKDWWCMKDMGGDYCNDGMGSEEDAGVR